MLLTSRMNIGAQMGFEIRRLRQARGWTQEELARRAGMPQREISLTENARRKLTVETLWRIARGFGVAPETLIAEMRLDQ